MTILTVDCFVAVAIVLDGEDIDSTVGYMEQSASQENYDEIVFYYGKMDE